MFFPLAYEIGRLLKYGISINSIDQKLLALEVFFALQIIECGKTRSFQNQSIELKQILINPLIYARDAHQLEIKLISFPGVELLMSPLMQCANKNTREVERLAFLVYH